MSALHATVAVLKTSGKPMRATGMIEAMARQRLRKSPGGETPRATLYAAINRALASSARSGPPRPPARGRSNKCSFDDAHANAQNGPVRDVRQPMDWLTTSTILSRLRDHQDDGEYPRCRSVQ